MNTVASSRTIFAGVLILVFAYALTQALDFSRTAAYFPVAVAIAGLMAAGGLLFSDGLRLIRGRVRHEESNEAGTREGSNETGAPTGMSPTGQSAAVFGWLVWILSYVVALWLFGMEIGTLVFLVASLRWIARAPWWGYVVAVGVVALLWYAALIFALEWPVGQLMGG